MRRADFFCEDFQEFGDVLADMAQEAEALAFMTPYRRPFYWLP
ncbi:hypothetical protein [Xanthomonas citri]|nr:hypothetical protein [Xanthomonas citri]